MNSSQGTPGEANFRYKLPKFVTKASLSLFVFHLRQSFESLKKDITIDECDFISQTLSRILPSLNVDICKHFALTGVISNNVHDSIDNDDVSGRHIELPGTSDNGRGAQGADDIPDDCEDDKQCIWCSNLTGSDNDKALCKDCVAIPERLQSLETRFQERFGSSDNNQGAVDREPNSTEPSNDPSARAMKDKTNDALNEVDRKGAKFEECRNELLSQKLLN